MRGFRKVEFATIRGSDIDYQVGLRNENNLR